MEAHNIPTVIHEGKQLRSSEVCNVIAGTREDFVRMAGAGRPMALQHLFLLSNPKARGGRGAKVQDLWDAVRRIEARGGFLWELSTGRRSSDREQRDDMIEDAIVALAKGRHKRGHGDRRRGRPKKTFPAEVLEHNKKVWDSRHHKSWSDCEKRFIGGMTAHDAWAEWGPRGD